MGPHVVDIDERGAAVKWTHSADRKIQCPPLALRTKIALSMRGLKLSEKVTFGSSKSLRD